VRTLLAGWTCLALALAGCGGRSPARLDAEQSLREALAGYRPLESRISLDLAYAPCRQTAGTPRCADLPAAGSEQRKELLVAARRYERSLVGAPAAAARRGGALLALISGSPNGITSAVKGLEAAAGLEAGDARLWNDLAAAYLVSAERDREPYDLVRALTAVERALNSDPQLREALFNRALILADLGLRAADEAAWRRFLVVESGSGWAREARAHLDALAKPPVGSDEGRRTALRTEALAGNRPEVVRLVGRSSQAAREVASDEMLPAWGAAVLRGDQASAGRALGAARMLGNALLAAGGDQTVAEAVQAIERAAAEKARPLGELARAHVEYQSGRQLYGALRVEDAAPRLAWAEAAMDRAGSPMGIWAASLLAGIELYRAKPERAATAFTGLVDRADPVRAPALCGRLFWGLGLVRGREGRLTEALVYYGRAAEAFGRAHEEINQAKVEVLMAEALKYLGQAAPAWSHRARALAVLERLPGSRDLHGELWEAADALLQDGQFAAALVFQQEDVVTARRSAEPFMAAEALLRLSRVLAALDRPEEALRELQEARVWNSRGGSAATAEVTTAQFDLQEGEIRRRTDPVGAERLLDRALLHLLAMKRPVEAPLAYLSRARARLAEGADGAAEDDLAAAIDLVARQRAPITDPAFRQSFADGAQGFFDELLLLRSRRQRPELGTLEAIERARTLAGEAFSGQAGTPSAARLTAKMSELPRDVVIVEFGLARDTLFRWVLTRAGAKLKVIAVKDESLSRWVERFVATVRGGGGAEEISRASAPLYALLVPSESEGVRPGARLVFIPDRILNAVPFAALRDPRGYLIERHCVSVAASATAYLAVATRRAPSRPRGWTALLVDDPEFDRELFPQLPRLTETRAETEEGRRLFAGSQVVRGKAAVRSRLLAELGRHEVFGFAGHAVANDRLPLDSYLVLAPAADRSDDGQLFARELAGRRLGALQLVVLSACQTIAATSRRGTGLSGLTGPFLDGGAAAVVATLWNVNDTEAGTLVAEFYRQFSGSGDAGGALREAQLAALRSSQPSLRAPAHWAGFQLAGSLRQPSP
jgi:CHAT domain-containing protein/tetratricopeptide (TPR) repeat protein